MLFSATYSDEVMDFAKRVVPDPTMIRLKRNEESLDNIKQVGVTRSQPTGACMCILTVPVKELHVVHT